MIHSSQGNRTYSVRSGDEVRIKTENPKKKVYKTYNTFSHNFCYEHAQKQKNTFIEVYADKSTPSDISKQSVLENNDDILQVIPLIRELLTLAESQSDETLTQDEYISILSKLKIRQACEGINESPKYFKFHEQDQQIRMEDFVAFFTSDVQNIEFSSFSREELVLKLGLEIFRAISKENIFLELRHLVNYMKEHKKLDVDLTSMLEIFDFFANPDQGILKTRTSLISFFHKNAVHLARALSFEFLWQLKQLNENKKSDENAGTRNEEYPQEGENRGSNIIKIYDSNAKCNIKSRQPNMGNTLGGPQNSSNNNKETGNVRDLERVIQTSQINLNLDKNLMDFDQQFFNFGISDVFQEILPKNRGWLMRKSNRYENKWSMVFFEIKDNRLISTKPTSLKKSIEVKSLEIHKCNLLEVMKRLDSQHHDFRKIYKRGNSNIKFTKKDLRKITHQKTEQDKPEYLFFIVDTNTKKTYLVKSPDNLIIGSIIRFYIMRDNGSKPQPFSNNEPEYSGVIEIAVCKAKCIQEYHSSLKSYSFKKQFLIIKHGRFSIYEMKTKDNLDLLEYETQIHTDYDLLPQTNQFMFSLARMPNVPPFQDLVSKKSNNNNNELISIQEDGPFLTGGIIRTLPYMSPKAHNEFGTPHMTYYEDLKVIEYNNNNNKASKGFFSNILRKIQSSIKKDSKIILACDTELKRRQWVLTLKFFSQLAQSALQRSSFTKDSGVSAQEDSHTMRNSFQTEVNPSFPDNGGPRTRHKKKPSSISFKQKATYNPDFIDVYKAQNKDDSKEFEDKISPRDIEVKPSNGKKCLPLITEPDASQHLDSEEILMTFTQFTPENFPFIMTKNNTLNNKFLDNIETEKLLFSNEIKSMSDVEIWQRFLLFFVQEKHSCAEFDLNNNGDNNNDNENNDGSVTENTEIVLAQDTEEMEEDISIRAVIVSDFSVNKQS